MGMQEFPGVDPATLDLPEYTISITLTEVDGPNVRIYCGCNRGGYIHWLYSAVMRADHLMKAIQRSSEAAVEAMTQSLDQLMKDARSMSH